MIEADLSRKLWPMCEMERRKRIKRKVMVTVTVTVTVTVGIEMKLLLCLRFRSKRWRKASNLTQLGMKVSTKKPLRSKRVANWDSTRNPLKTRICLSFAKLTWVIKRTPWLKMRGSVKIHSCRTLIHCHQNFRSTTIMLRKMITANKKTKTTYYMTFDHFSLLI